MSKNKPLNEGYVRKGGIGGNNSTVKPDLKPAAQPNCQGSKQKPTPPKEYIKEDFIQKTPKPDTSKPRPYSNQVVEDIEIIKIPRQYSLVKLSVPKDIIEYYANFVNKTFCYLGEIPNMQGHAILIDIYSKEIHIGMHIENFKELAEV